MRALLLLLPLLCCTGCPSGDAKTGAPPKVSGNDAFDLAKARGELIVATDAGYVPFEVMSPDGTFSGFDVDLLQEVAKDLGLKCTIRNVAWDGIIGELRTSKVDMIMSGMSITKERQEVVDFSEPYYQVGQVLVKRKGDERLKSIADLNKEGLIIGTQQNTTGEKAAREQCPKATFLTFPKLDQACLALQQSKADAVVFDLPGLHGYLRENPTAQLEGIWKPFTAEAIGAAFRKDSPKLRAAFDATLARLRKEGRYDALVKQHFAGLGAPPAQQPADAAQKTE
ncbi:MAG: substrate-binding periplasmic protein [Planctomycetota bacterium]